MLLSLYIHIPWCIKKCPYCDFNSHKQPEDMAEEAYVNALIADLEQDRQHIETRKLHSIFIGGGTPSLFSAKSYEKILNSVQKHFHLATSIEITLEANPGTAEQQRFADYRRAGINRLSLGIQSFNPQHLKTLGRIHDDEQSRKAIICARQAGFDNINLDLMYGLPKQSIAECLADLNIALAYQPEHLSWYQLNIEPNTVFYKQRPPLPSEDNIETMEQEGFACLREQGLARYEISAFAKEHHQSQHNLNYWLFGDYLGIGAGAHGKLTKADDHSIFRTRKHRQPNDYLNLQKTFTAAMDRLSENDKIFEFMLNTSRLEQAIPQQLFEERTGLDFNKLLPGLKKAEQKGFLKLSLKGWQITALGRRFTNDLQSLFLA